MEPENGTLELGDSFLETTTIPLLGSIFRFHLKLGEGVYIHIYKYGYILDSQTPPEKLFGPLYPKHLLTKIQETCISLLQIPRSCGVQGPQQPSVVFFWSSNLAMAQCVECHTSKIVYPAVLNWPTKNGYMIRNWMFFSLTDQFPRIGINDCTVRFDNPRRDWKMENYDQIFMFSDVRNPNGI